MEALRSTCARPAYTTTVLMGASTLTSSVEAAKMGQNAHAEKKIKKRPVKIFFMSPSWRGLILISRMMEFILTEEE
jgi:hypothetical protein